MSGNFLSCSKGVKDSFEVPEVRSGLPRDASAEMGLIAPGGENLLDFFELWQVLSSYDGVHRDPLWWTQERPVARRVARGHLGVLPSRCRSLRPCVESGPEPEDSCPQLTCILG